MSVTNHTQRQWFRTHVQSLMSTILGAQVEPDADGDFLIHGDTASGWVRADGYEPMGAQIWVIAARGVPEKVATLREINQINGHELAVKVGLYDGGVVVVTYRLLADAVTAANLRAAIGRVMTVADEIGPLLTAVHGGHTPIPLEPSASDA